MKTSKTATNRVPSHLWMLAWAVGSVMVVGCSGGTDSSGEDTDKDKTPSQTGDKDKDPGPTTHEKCVKPADKGNDLGVGAYCDKSGIKCKSGLLCTASAGAKDDEPWFCTKPCAQDSDCGSGATCYAEARGKGCLPVACQ